MATRQIKDAKDLSTGNLIYFKGHAQATFMSDGRNVEDAINSVSDSIDSIDTSSFATASDMQEAQSRILLMQTEMGKKQNRFKINGNAINLDDNIEVAELDLGANGRYAMADGLVDGEDNYYSLPSNPDNYGDANILATKADVNAKQDKLVSGSNIITINNNSILGSGNFDLATTEQLRSFQPTLVSGTNIKTINSTSLLGSGNIAIKDTKNLTYILNNSTSGTVTLQPNACIYMPNPITDILAINACSTYSSNNADLIESRICFRMPNKAILPVIQFNGVAIRWAGGNAPTFEADFTYEVSLFYPSNANSVGPMGVCVGFK